MLNDKESSWFKLPPPLQHQFFKLAEEEARRCKARMQRMQQKIRSLSSVVKGKPILDSDEWLNWRVLVVDGSNSPTTSERLGIRVGTYCASYLIFEGKRQVDEGYISRCYTAEQSEGYSNTLTLLELLRLNLERELAYTCLKKMDVDWVILDGSFFGFRAAAYKVREEILGVDGYRFGRELISNIRDKTLALMDSRKAVGVIKRSRSTAIDGWLLYKYRDPNMCVGANDKHILTALLPPKHYFSYEWLFERPEAYNFYAQIKSLYNYAVLSEKKVRNIEQLYDKAKRSVSHSIHKSLEYAVERIIGTSRHFVRCNQPPPFEFEVKAGTDIEPLLSYFKSFHNPATGLPWPLDLVDLNTSLPRGFNKEFVEEIEALLINDASTQKDALSDYFTHLNPQKDED
ncbi:MAG: DNA double-strand break repair nuclease NurA [Nitrososphaerales archaeon]